MGQHESSKKTALFGNNTYDFLKFVAQLFLPALGTLYTAVAGLWGFPNVQEVVGTIVAVDLFLGALLGLSSARYNESDEAYDGKLYVGEGETPDAKTVGIKVDTPPQELPGKREVRLKVEDFPEPEVE